MVEIFQNKWAIILGGSSGLGLASAFKLSQKGMNICIIHRNSRTEMETIESNFETIRDLGVSFLNYNIDVTNPEKRAFFISDFRLKTKAKCSVLLHSIAKGTLKQINSEDGLTLDDYQITMHAMAFSLMEWVQSLANAKMFETDTRIISFTSEGNLKYIPNYNAVSAAKVALESISRQIAVEYAPFGIKSNCIQAGLTLTKSLTMIPNVEKIIAIAEKRNPNKRITTTEDIANVVYLLCLPEARWITGAIIKADGGESLL